MSTSVPALLRSTTETEYLAPENTPASAADAWAVRSRSGWAGAGTAALNMLRDADWERTLPDPDLSEKLRRRSRHRRHCRRWGRRWHRIGPHRLMKRCRTSHRHRSSTRARTIAPPSSPRRTSRSAPSDGGAHTSAHGWILFGRQAGSTADEADTTAGMRHDAAQDTSRPAPRRAHMLCHRAPPDCSHRRPHCNPPNAASQGRASTHWSPVMARLRQVIYTTGHI